MGKEVRAPRHRAGKRRKAVEPLWKPLRIEPAGGAGDAYFARSQPIDTAENLLTDFGCVTRLVRTEDRLPQAHPLRQSVAGGIFPGRIEGVEPLALVDMPVRTKIDGCRLKHDGAVSASGH